MRFERKRSKTLNFKLILVFTLILYWIDKERFGGASQPQLSDLPFLKSLDLAGIICLQEESTSEEIAQLLDIGYLHRPIRDFSIPSTDDISEIILREEYLDVLENPNRKEQLIFIIRFNEYIYAVPFIIDEDENIILKTAYPSRKFHKRYGDQSI